jgi:hypothetical protein
MGEGLSGEDLERAYHRARYGDPSGTGDGSEQPNEQHPEQLAASDGGSGEVKGDATEDSGDEPSEPESYDVAGAPESEDQQLAPMPESSSSSSGERSREQRDPVRKEMSPREALEWLRRAKTRLEIAEEETGEDEEIPVEADAGGGVVSKGLNKLTGSSDSETEVRVTRTPAEEELCEACREEVEEARKALRYALERRDVEYRHIRQNE